MVCALVIAAAGCGRQPTVEAETAALTNALANGPGGEIAGMAAAALKSNDFASGVIALDQAKRVPGMTPEQLMAVQNAQQAVTATLVNRAASGDAAAKAALAAIERSRTQ